MKQAARTALRSLRARYRVWCDAVNAWLDAEPPPPADPAPTISPDLELRLARRDADAQHMAELRARILGSEQRLAQLTIEWQQARAENVERYWQEGCS